MKINPNVLLALCLFTFGTGIVHAQKFLNGSLEANGNYTCIEDMTNQKFNTLMNDVVGLGETSKLDLYDASCGKGYPVDGKYFVGLQAEGGITDAIAFALDQDLSTQKTYYLEFYARLDAIPTDEYALALGINFNPNSNGDLMATFRDLSTSWKKYKIFFRTPIVAKYITALIESRGKVKIYLDGFSFKCPEISLGRDTTYCAYSPKKLEIGNRYDNILWSDGSEENSFTPGAPGIYSVKASFGSCVLADTISLMEDPAICSCNIFVPNVFSPFASGENNKFLIRSTCDLEEYSMEIYDRWGNLVFLSKDPNELWLGEFNGKSLPTGTYICSISFLQDKIKKVSKRETSSVTLIR